MLFCGGIILGWVAESILTSGPDLLADGKTWFAADYRRIISLSMIVQGIVAALGAALCLGRAFAPLTSVSAPNETTGSGLESATLGGGPVLPICGILFLYAAFALFMSARYNLEELERLEREPIRSGDERVDNCRRLVRTERTFGVLWLIVGGMLLGTPLFLKPRVWKLGWRLNGAYCGIAIIGLLLSGMGLGVWRVNGTFLKGAFGFYSLVGLLGVLAGSIVTLFGSIKAVTWDRPSDRVFIERPRLPARALHKED